jgi:4-hydroxy-4-methyl-2-oxoglutarate aldolase
VSDPGFSPHTVTPATVHEAAGRRGALPSRIKPVSDAMYVQGPAFTTRLAPGDNLGLHRAIYAAKPGDVLVADTGGHFEYGYWGEILNEAAMARGLAGLVLDGGVRDVARLRASQFPVFSAGICIRGTIKDPASAIAVSTTIRIGEVTVRPGDLVVGDVDGVVVIPSEDTSEVLQASAEREEREEKIISRVQAGESTLEIYGLDPGTN